MKVVKKALCVGVLTLTTACVPGMKSPAGDQVWRHPKREQQMSYKDIKQSFVNDKQDCYKVIEALDVIPNGVYDPDFAPASFEKCLLGKGWKFEMPTFNKAYKINDLTKGNNN